jgi:hypothetical protein
VAVLASYSMDTGTKEGYSVKVIISSIRRREYEYMGYDTPYSHMPNLYLPAVRPVPHPADKEQKVNYEDSCTLARRRRPPPRCHCHPPQNRGEPFAANASWRRQGFGLPNTLQKHITVVTVCQICSSVTCGNSEKFKAEVTDFHMT